jgi:hypothetical protein
MIGSLRNPPNHLQLPCWMKLRFPPYIGWHSQQVWFEGSTYQSGVRKSESMHVSCVELSIVQTQIRHKYAPLIPSSIHRNAWLLACPLLDQR